MRERFTTEMKEAMKAGDKRKLATVRLIQAALKDKDIEARGAGKGQATDEEAALMLSTSSSFVPTLPICGNVKVMICPA